METYAVTEQVVPEELLDHPLLAEQALRPSLTIGIAAYNEEGNIGQLLCSLLSQTAENDRIVVIASGCSDGTVNIVRGHAIVNPKVLLTIEHERRGKARAINRILSMSGGDMILLVSADVIPDQGSIGAMIEAMESDESIGAVSSRPVPINHHHGLLGRLVHLHWDLHDTTLSTLDAMGLNTHGGEAILMRRGIIRSIPENCINDDAYIGVETVKRGFRVRYCRGAVVRMKGPETISELLSQRRRIISGHLMVKRLTDRYPRVLSIMAFANPLRAIRIIGAQLRKNPRSLGMLFVGVYFEGVSACLALFDLLVGRDPTIWRIATTTKSLE